MLHLIKPIAIALKGKGPAAFLKRVTTISQRYGVNAGKMDHCLNQLSQLLKKFDCRATLPITTVALARNSAIVQKYQAQGIEFAIHGYRHIDHSQLSMAEQTAHFRKANQIFEQQGIKCEGFRGPYLRWNDDTLAALSQTKLAYDSSNSLVWDIDNRHKTDSYHRALDFYGAQPASDYLAVPNFDLERDLVRIPYCLPDDESLVERLIWQTPAEMDAIWLTMFHKIHERGELFNLGLHPERTVNCLASLRVTLEAIQTVAPEVWRARLSEITTWWKARYKADIEITEPQHQVLHLSVKSPKEATLLLRNVEVKSATDPWFNGYRVADQSSCLIHSSKRPFIGIAPESSPDLVSFLKQQGYIVEISSEPESYSFYLDHKTFSKADEWSLITAIETGSFSLVRLGRWPNRARSAFCVTGDIDALTIWDYGLRFAGY